jgi:hypothetical protein
MSERKKLIEKAKMPAGKKVKKKLDSWIDENVNVPLAKRGHDKAGAAISALLSAGGDMMIPDDVTDLAAAMVPGARLAKLGKKGIKAIKKAKMPKGEPKTLNYKDIEAEEAAKRLKKRQESEARAETLRYSEDGKKITREQPDLYDHELRAKERRRKRRSK